MAIFKNLSGWMHRHLGKGQMSHAEREKAMRENKTHKQIDKTINDSFPASDPPSTY